MSNTEILGQYASDRFIHAGNPALDRDPNKQKAIRGDGNFGFHQGTTLFDQGDGDIDEATGQVIRNSAGLDEELLSLEGVRVVNQLPLRRNPPRLDEADRWLMAHDPTYKPGTGV